MGFQGIGSSVSKDPMVWKDHPVQASYPPQRVVKNTPESHIKDPLAMTRSIYFTLLLFRSKEKIFRTLSIKHCLSFDAFICNALGKE